MIKRRGLRWHVQTDEGRYFGYRHTPRPARWLVVKAKRIMGRELHSEPRSVCACTVHPSGRGLLPCMHHAQRIAEHQRMYRALAAIRDGKIDTDPATAACVALGGDPTGGDFVRFWHG